MIMDIKELKATWPRDYLGAHACCKECKAIIHVGNLTKGRICPRCWCGIFILPDYFRGVRYTPLVYNAYYDEFHIDLPRTKEYDLPISDKIDLTPRQLQEWADQLTQNYKESKALIKEGSQELERALGPNAK